MKNLKKNIFKAGSLLSMATMAGMGALTMAGCGDLPIDGITPPPPQNPGVEDVNLYWTVDFDSNGGSAVESHDVLVGQYIRLQIPEKNGYVFVGWTLNGTVVYSQFFPNADVTLVASWQEDPGTEIPTQTFTVVFETNGGDSMPDMLVDDGDYISLPNPSRGGYEFHGWYTNEAFTDAVVLTDGMFRPTADVTLFARWEEIYVGDNRLLVQFHCSHGTAPPHMSVEYGDIISLPGYDARDRFEFDGWLVNGVLLPVDYEIKVTGAT